jgi:hypothetical protein
MDNVLDVVLRPAKVTISAPPKVPEEKVDEPKLINIADTSSNLDKAGPSRWNHLEAYQRE